MPKKLSPSKSEPLNVQNRKRKMLHNERSVVDAKRQLKLPYGGSNRKQNTAENDSKNLFADITHSNTGSNNWSKFKELQLKTKPPLSKLIANNTVRLQKVALSKSVSNSGKDKDIYKVSDKDVYKVSIHKKVKPYNTKCIAIDCEMVGIDDDGKNDMLARVSLVNAFGECVYDKFVKPMEPVVDYRTYVSGVRPGDLENGEDFKTVQKEVADAIKGKKLIGHALKNDLRVLFLTHPRWAMRDTSKYHKFREACKSTPSLKRLAEKYLGVKIQEGEHSSVEDANAAMQLYLVHRRDWEEELRRKRKGLNKCVKHTPAEHLTVDNV